MKIFTSKHMHNTLLTADRNEIKAIFYKISALTNSKHLTPEEKIILSKSYLLLKQIIDIWKAEK